MRRIAAAILFLGPFLLAVATPVAAQTSAGPFARSGSSAAPADAPRQAKEPGIFTRALTAVLNEQRKFHRKLASALEDIRNRGGTAAAWTLIVTSFLYGVFHAAGPGHGKAILTTYLATHRQRIPRGILLSAAAAALQGAVAIVLVFGLTIIAGWAARDTQSAARWAEQFSFALVALLGAYLLYRAAKGIWHALAPHGGIEPGAIARDACHAHGHCGHAHLPTGLQLEKAGDLKAMAGVILSIGIRPCSGAVLVLGVANLFAIPWAGIVAVCAISLGTAIAVATLALAVLSARRLVSALLATDNPRFAIAGQAVALAGGAIILFLGITLLAGSFGPAHPLGL